MDIKCSNCSCNLNDAVPQSSYIQLSCSHFLCNNCLSRKILQQNFKPLTSKNLVELICDCKGKKLISFKECLDKVSKPLILDNRDKKNSNKCFYHKEYNKNIFCKDCKRFICEKCEKDETNPENNHVNHSVTTLEEYIKAIKNIKNNLKFKNLDQCLKYIDEKQDEILQDFNKKCDESKKIIEDAFKKLEEIKKDYNLKIEKEKINLKNTFLIMRQVYNNFYAELEIKNSRINLPSFEFITKIKKQLNNINYNPINFDEIEKISSALNKIDTSHFYEIKFDFSKVAYDQSESQNLGEGILVLCPLTSIKNSFACGTEKGKIKILSKKEGDYEYTESGIWSAGHESNLSSITSLVELKKLENYLISGGSDKIVRIFSISKYDNNCRIIKEKEFENGGIILDIFQLSNGRIAYSTSNNTISIIEINTDNKKFENIITIKNNDVGFEKCLSEIQIFENDEKNKQLVTGGINGILKRWDINSSKLEEKIKLGGKKLLTCITIINNHKLAIGTEEGYIIIFDYFRPQNCQTIYGHRNSINHLFFSRYNHNLFTCSKDRNIKIWNIDNLKCTNILENSRGKNFNDIILCGNDLISCSIDHNIYIYNIEGNENDENNEEYNDFS